MKTFQTPTGLHSYDVLQCCSHEITIVTETQHDLIVPQILVPAYFVIAYPCVPFIFSSPWRQASNNMADECVSSVRAIQFAKN
jgi:hypothetical protein